MKSVQPLCSNRCNICVFEKLPQKKTLLTCQGCKLVSYCGENHQKLDWLIHKEFCKAVQSIIKTNEVVHPHLIHGTISSKFDLQKAVVNLKKLVVFALGRNLEPFEEEYVTCPRYCNKCLNLKIYKQFDCMNCQIVGYCSSDCREKDSLIHSKDCHNIKVYYNFWQENIFHLNLKPNFLNLDWETLDLFDIIGKLNTNEDTFHKIVNNQEEYQKFGTVSDYSYVSTILYIFNYCQFMHNLHDTCTIYIVGAEDEFNFFREAHCSFLISQIPNVLNINLYFIGPLLQRTEPIIYDYTIDQKKKRVKLEFYKKKFESYVQHRQFNFLNDVFGNLIICYNCGFSEFSNSKLDTWRDALDAFLKLQRTPIAFTSYTYLESKLDLKEICLADTENTTHIMIKNQKNSFRDYRPIRNWEISDESDLIFHRNNYLTVIMPRPNVIQAENQYKI